MRKFIYLFLLVFVLASCTGEAPETKIKVSFDTQGGVEILDQEIDFITGYELPIPIKEGYDFLYWDINIRSLNTSPELVETELYLIAVWKKKEEEPVINYTITIDNNNGDEIITLSLPEFSLLEEPNIPIKEGYKFIEWQTNGVKYDFTKPITSDLNLIAIYEEVIIETDIEINTLPNKLVFDYNENLDLSGLTINKLLSNNEKVLLDDYEVITDYNKLIPNIYTVTIKYLNFTVSFEVEVLSVPIEYVEILFNVDGNITTKTIIKDNKVEKPNNPVKEGYEFLYWTLNNLEFDFNTKITTNIELVAKFKEIIVDPDLGVAITTVQEFNEAVNDTNKTKYYLANDLDFNGYTYNMSSNTFIGELNGNNKTIYNLTINSSGYAGIFNKLSGSIYDLTIKNANITGRSSSGIIAGETTGLSSIKNITVYSSSVKSDSEAVGGLVGLQSKNTQILTISNIGLYDLTINNSKNSTGGVVGLVNSNTLKLTDVEVNVTINSTGSKVGGLVGDVKNSNALVEVTNALVNANVTGKDDISLVVGYYAISNSSSKSKINNVLLTGSLTATGSDLGHLSGHNNLKTVTNTYAYNVTTNKNLRRQAVSVLDEISLNILDEILPNISSSENWVYDGTYYRIKLGEIDTILSVSFISDMGYINYTETVIKGEKIEEPSIDELLGYKFVGWLNNNELFDFSNQINESLTLVAKWEKIPTYEITYDNEVLEVNEGSYAPNLKLEPIARKVFDGWYKEGVKFNFNTPIYENIVLQSKWRDATTYTLTYVTNNDITLDPIVLYEDEKVILPELSKSGYVFLGWFTDLEFTNKFDQLYLNENTTIYAYFIDEIEYIGADYEVQGFAQPFISIPNYKEGDPEYRVVYNELDFIEAIRSKNSNNQVEAKVIEIRSDLNMGYKELERKYGSSSGVGQNAPATKHPILMESGVSKMNIQNKNGLLIYSKTGHVIKHIGFVIKNSTNVTIRNLEFDELWEWDESNAEYDNNDWDYFTLESVEGVWFDHITMRKAYDGLIDLKVRDNEGSAARNVTISWSKFLFEYNNPFVVAQFEYLENNRGSNPYYNKMRESGMSVQEIIDLNSSQKKGFLVGQSKFKPQNANLTLTIHNTIVKNLQERFPRARGGNAHIYNVIFDSTELNETINHVKSTYKTLFSDSNYARQASSKMVISTENAAVLMENSIVRGVKFPVRNNQNPKEYREFSGKYRVLNSIYEYEDVYFKGSDLDTNSPFVSDTTLNIIDFSWNNMNKLPYEYRLIDVDLLEDYMNSREVGTTSNYSLIS